MPEIVDGPASSRFTPLILKGNTSLAGLAEMGVSQAMTSAVDHAPCGACVGRGIPFQVEEVIVIKDQAFEIAIPPTAAGWFIFLHTADAQRPERNRDGFISPMRGNGHLGEVLATYVMCYEDGAEERVPIRGRFQISPFQRNWGEECFEAVPYQKAYPMEPLNPRQPMPWGVAQTRLNNPHDYLWASYLWAWENPHPEKVVTGFRFEPGSGVVLISAVSAGNATSLPIRWNTRAKACLRLSPGETFQPGLDEKGRYQQVQLDLGQVISAFPRMSYPNSTWQETYNNQNPAACPDEVLVEYTAHPDACFYLSGGRVIPVAEVEAHAREDILQPVAPARQTVRLRVVERASRKTVPVKLHVHGEWGEYLTPVDRHRILNPFFFEDYAPEFAHVDATTLGRMHNCTYINGETVIKLPVGKVYVEASRGFEVRPVRQVIEVTPDTEEVVIEVEKVLPWREKGWVTADTHVHFLSPLTAMLEGSAEGVNVINLLSSQWGELMTNVGDFDGHNTWGSREAGGDGEHLVRVGTENRQHVMGHISLLGYDGRVIAPMTTAGPDESAIGDPLEILLTEWARQCKKQGGLVVLPHFPNPRAEHAASIVSGEIDAVEMTSWEDHYNGIDPYSLSDWYRYLNCGYLVPVVGGTDKMGTCTAVGTVRTYAHLEPEDEFTYDAWKAAVRRAETFVSYGPLLEFAVNGKPMGSRLSLPAGGGTLDVVWQAASITVPMTRVELVVNGEIRESVPVDAGAGADSWSIKTDRSVWLALLVRGHYPDRPEIIVAHSSPVMVQVGETPLLAAADAVTILEQIEGALAFLDTVGTRAEDRAYKRMRLVIQSAYSSLHNRMHAEGHFHEPK